jgi:CheY-like chemotaxis protein
VLAIDVSSERVVLSTDAVVAEQVLVSVLSRAIGQAYPGTMELDLRADDEQVSLTVRYYQDPEAPSETPLDLVAKRLIDRLGWTAEHSASPDGPSAIAFSMTRKGPSILVIDDNEGLVTLVQRYLTDHAYRVVPAKNGQDGLRLAQDLLPDAIVLDVMMPEMPGWEVLQRLRNHPKTAHIPVIICSVFNNPELAFSLGASLFLPKPVGREDVLNALHSLDVG